MRRKQIAGFLLAAMLCLTGCSNTAIEADTLSLLKDGTATYTIVTDFSEDYYDLEELKAMAQEEVTAYGNGVQITEAMVEEGILHFQYMFDSLTHYAGFMETTCYQGTVELAVKNGYKSDIQLVSAKDGSTILMNDEEIQGYQLFVWNEEVAVKGSRKVLYYSGNLNLNSKNSVVPKEGTSGPYYVVFK